jgi:hypothetical protein
VAWLIIMGSRCDDWVYWYALRNAHTDTRLDKPRLRWVTHSHWGKSRLGVQDILGRSNNATEARRGLLQCERTSTSTYVEIWQLTINDCLRLVPFLAGPRASSLLLWRTKDSCSRLEVPWTTFVCGMNLEVLVLYYDLRSVGQTWNKAAIWGLRPDYLLLRDSCRFGDVGRCLWREYGSVVYNCCWPLPAQSFSCPSTVGLVTIFYGLKFETSLFVAS